MKKLLCLVLCFAALMASVLSAQAEAPTLSEKAQAIADVIVEDYGAVSVQYAIIDGGQIVLSGASGVFDKAGNRPVSKDDMFGIGSTSKMFATASTMLLRDQGLLDIDAPLTTYIPEFTMADERYKEITPRMLMNHSAGLYGSSFSNTFMFDDNVTVQHDTLLSKLATQRLRHAPGAMCEYSNDGFSLLELMIERIAGIPYTQFLAENFTGPLGLKNTKTSQDPFDRATRLVKTYSPFYDGALPDETVNALGTGGLYSTAEDLCRFAQVLMGEKPEILSEEAVRTMQEEEYKKGIWVEHEGDNLSGFGLGWDTVHSFPFGEYGIQALTKGGDTQLFHSSLVVVPEYGIAMAVASSGGSSTTNYAFAASALQELLLEKRIIDAIAPERTLSTPVRAEMPEKLDKYSGLYVNAAAGARVEVGDGLLTVMPLDGSPEASYVYVGNEVFQSEDGSVGMTFTKQADGNVYLQKSVYSVRPGVGQLAVTMFDSQKVEPVALPEPVLEVWRARAGKKYYVVSEMPTSQAYFLGIDKLQIKLKEEFSDGFALGGIRIVDENHAVNTVKFRDATDLTFDVRDGVEYLWANDLVFVREDGIPEMTAETAHCEIGADGFARYFAIGPDVEGKTIDVAFPEGAQYAVYDENIECVNFTTVSGNRTTVLPPKGKIAFIGKPGDTFTIKFH